MTTPYSSYSIPGNQTPFTPNPAQIAQIQTQTTAQFASVLSSAHFDSQSQPGTPTPAGRGRPRGSGTGAKRGRKPKNAVLPEASSPRPFMTNTFASNVSSASGVASSSTSGANAQYPRVHWAMPNSSTGGTENTEGASTSMDGGSGSAAAAGNNVSGEVGTSNMAGDQAASASGQNGDALPMISSVIDPALIGAAGTVVSGSRRATPIPDVSTFPGRGTPQPPPTTGRGGTVVVDEEAEGDDELLPAMADDDYSAQLSWQSQSKDNLKVLMDNLSPAQYDRFEAYRRHALPKQAVRKVGIVYRITKQLSDASISVSQPVAQIIAGFSKVFVGEIVEKARAVQTRRGDTGPLSPDHLREAYRAYQEETGHVGAARPIRAKKLFVR
ncbi:hypothetical protein CVT25_011540 [Psilocybe cyanescens]|uniref:TAFII28-like protein domain-containing protein n=1 Tax=Psilocybe cyanescens TaxID=93625 RepID=A0A409XCG1_PSICY|nr:hypothetical protein CVT25_011540 [Psilocybe cyanescens]